MSQSELIAIKDAIDGKKIKIIKFLFFKRKNKLLNLFFRDL